MQHGVSYAGAVCWNRGSKRLLNVMESADILLQATSQDPVSGKVPIAPRDDCTFVMQIDALKSWKDALCDDSGQWIYSHGPRSSFYINSPEGLSSICKLHYTASENGFHFLRLHFHNRNASDFKRIVVRPADARCKYLLIQYRFDNESHEFSVQKHGNRNHGELAYTRTFPSTLSDIKSVSLDVNLTALQEQRTHFEHVENPSEPIRNKRQILNHERKP